MRVDTRVGAVLVSLFIGVAACGGSDDGVDAEPTTTMAPARATSTTLAPTTSDRQSSVESVRFASGEFELVGELHHPGIPGPRGALVIVHSSGPQTRHSTPSSSIVRQRFLDAGYAVLIWDKPGSGESTGTLDPEYRTTQLATIVTEAVALLASNPSIDPERIGLWGLSQAGWVMPMALTMTDDVAFMIVVSGGGEDSVENQAYQWERNAGCLGASAEDIALIERHGAAALKATTYEEYREAMEAAMQVRELDRYVGVHIELATEDEWVPWPRDIDAFFNPIHVIERTTIPVLAIFGEHDRQVDPIQGSTAYERALAQAGNALSHVEVIPGVDHILAPASENGCSRAGSGYSPRYLELLDEWIQLLEDAG